MLNVNGKSRKPSSDTVINDVDGLSGLQRTDIIDGASSSEMATDEYVAADYIPEWLLLNVLIRLPSKSVFRCKLVSKRCASLISDPFFVRSYLAHSSTSSSSWTVVEKRMDPRYKQKVAFIEYGKPKDAFSKQNFGTLYIPYSHRREIHESYNVLGASNGLILFGMSCYRRASSGSTLCNLFYVCNPTTRKLIFLSPHSRGCPIECEGWGFVSRVEDAVLRSFRVVLLTRDRETERLRSTVYASETREWSEFLFSNAPYVSRNRPTALNQTLHWDAEGGSIVAYDPYENPHDMRLIAPPEDADERDMPVLGSRSCCLCDASGGKLRYFEGFDVASAFRLKLYVLDDYASGTWRVLHQSDHTFKYLSPMFSDPFDSDVLYLTSGKRLVWYDVKSGKFEVGRRSPPERGAFVLQLSPWPVSITPCTSATNDI